ncbi:MAG: glycosyltransferase [Gammaproteobacteria bacterium]
MKDPGFMSENDRAADYSLIVPAFNEAEYLTETLDSLARAIGVVAAEHGFQGEVIVVDNNSTDGTSEVAGGHPLAADCLRVVFEPINQISKARNVGASVACSQNLIFVDADTSIEPVLIVDALHSLNSAAVGGGARIKIDVAHRGGEFATGVWNKFAGFAKYAAGCFLFCRKDAFDAVGGFSEKVYASEEIWLTRALKKWGKANGLHFVVLDDYVITSGRKLAWLSTFAMVKQVAVITLFPFALKYKRFCGAWYQRPQKKQAVRKQV